MTDIKTIPEGWELKKLGEVCKLKNGFAFKSDKYESKGIPVIRISDIKDGIIKIDRSIRVSEAPEYDNYLVNPDDILIAMSGATTGKFGIYKANHKAYQNQRVGNFQILTKQLAKSFLFYQLHALKRQVEKDAYGGAQPNISSKKIEEMEILLPPLNKQEVIVSKIEELFSELDKGIAELRLAQEQLKVYRQSVLKYAFEGKLTNDNIKDGELPEGWEIKDLGNVIEKPKYGTSKKCDYNFGETGVLRIPNIAKGIVDSNDLKYAHFDTKERETYCLKKNDILIIRSNGSVDLVGKCALISSKEEKFLYAGYLIRLRPIAEKVIGKYLLYILNSGELRRQIESKAKSTSGVNNINSEEISSLQIPLAPFIHQTSIIQEIEKRLSVADKMEESITESLQKAEALRQSILKKAFSGELVTEAKAIEIPKIKNEYFHQLQLVALVINGFKKKKIDHGEMTLAKNLYLLDSIYKIPTGFKYDRWHLGPYPPALKKVVNNKEYFKRNELFIEATNDDKLQKYTNPYQDEVNNAINDLSSIFSKYKGAERSHKTELLATVCKVIEDVKSTDLQNIRQSMTEWKIELKTSHFKNKAEKFNEAETEKCITFIVEKGWDRKLVST